MAGICHIFTMESHHRIPTLDGWRAVAIAAVILSHGFLLPGATTRPVRALGYVAGHLGGTGVALFFAISGYLITTLLLEERERWGRISLRGFYIRRAFRILPPAYLYLILLAGSLQRGELFSAAFFYSNYWPERSWYTQHFWSLSMEEHFYLFWPALLGWLGVRRGVIAASFLVGATILWRPWSLVHVHLPYPALQRTDMRLDAFLFAGTLAILLHGPYRVPILEVLTAAWFRFLSALILLSTWIWTVAGSAPATGILVESLLLPCLLVSMIHWPGSLGFRLLELFPLCWMGRISYGLYLWQQFFFVHGSVVTPDEAAKTFFPRVALTFAVATASYYLLERPLLTYGRSVARRFLPEVEPSSIMEQ